MHASLNAIIRTTIWLKKSRDILIPGLRSGAERPPQSSSRAFCVRSEQAATQEEDLFCFFFCKWGWDVRPSRYFGPVFISRSCINMTISIFPTVTLNGGFAYNV